MMTISSVFLAPLQGLLSTFQSERHYNDKKKDEALIAIRHALLETQKHIEISKGRISRETEYQIAQLWGEASVKARHASKELSRRLHDKSKYWADTIEWSREEVLGKQIDFDSIEQDLNKLLGSPK
jgi:hypothetical protein